MSNNEKSDGRSRITKEVLRKMVTTMITIMMTLTTKGLVYNGRIPTNSQRPDQIGTTMVAVFLKGIDEDEEKDNENDTTRIVEEEVDVEGIEVNEGEPKELRSGIRDATIATAAKIEVSRREEDRGKKWNAKIQKSQPCNTNATYIISCTDVTLLKKCVGFSEEYGKRTKEVLF